MDSPRVYKYPLQSNVKANEKMSVPPLIFPRLSDRDVWSYPSYRHSAVNTNNMGFDVSEEYTGVPQVDDYSEYDPRVSTYTNFSLSNLGDVCASNQFKPNGGQYGGQFLPPNSNNNSIAPSNDMNNIPMNSTPIVSRTVPQRASQMEPFRMQNQQPFKLPMRGTERYSNPVGTSPVVFQDNNYNNNYPSSIPAYPETMYPLNTFPQYVAQNQAVQPIPEYNPPTMSIAGPTQDWFNSNNHPPSDLLIPKNVTSIYGPGAVTNEERIKYLETIEPDVYTLSDVAYPINANMGISYNPDIPPMMRDQVATPYGTYPLYSRIDPQLVRDQNISPSRLQEMPRRNDWSARYATFDAQPGTVGFEHIYDGRFNGYGDENRAYGDVDLGQVQYYYSDVEAYRNPNFTDRSKVDFIDFIDPQGKVYPEYRRQVGVDDIRQTVENQFMADSQYFRQDLMERQMLKINSQRWQNRSAPWLKTSHTSSFTSNY